MDNFAPTRYFSLDVAPKTAGLEGARIAVDLTTIFTKADIGAGATKGYFVRHTGFSGQCSYGRNEPNRDAQKMIFSDRGLVKSHMEIVNLLLRILQVGADRTTF